MNVTEYAEVLLKELERTRVLVEKLQESQDIFDIVAKDSIQRVRVAELKQKLLARKILSMIAHARYNINTAAEPQRTAICNTMIDAIETFCEDIAKRS